MKKYLLVTLLATVMTSLSFGQTLYSQTFNGSLGNCTVVNYNTGALAWAFSAYGFSDPNFGTVYFNSPTGNNGAALILSDGNANAINTDLITPAINCTGQTYVALQFDQFLDVYNTATATVSVSSDSVNWTQVFDAFQDLVNNGGQVLDPELVQLDISAYAANQPKVWVKWNYQATNDLWYAVDDIKVYVLPTNDVAVDSVVLPNYVPASNGTTTVQATIRNAGGAPLNSVDLSYQIGSNTPVTQTFSTLGISPFGSSTVQFTTQANFDSAIAYTVKITGASPNGGADANSANNSATRQIVGLTEVPSRNVLVEEFSTAICGYCPGGATYIKEIMESADSAFVIPVSIHAGFGTDGMTTTYDDTLANDLDQQGAPSAAIDRELYWANPGLTIGVPGLPGPNDWQTAAETEHGVISPVSITASNVYNASTRVVTVTVNSTFYGPASGAFRMNCYITEDSVVGSGGGYNQHSYYYSSPAAGSNPWFHVGSYSASNGYATISGYVHNHVDRKLLNGTYGEASSVGNIPSTVTPGTTYTQTYTYTLPGTWRTQFIKLVPFVSQYNASITKSEYNIVWNAASMKLNSSTTTGVDELSVTNNEKIVLYPNPAQNVVTLAYTLDNDARLSFEVYNMLGQMVSADAPSNFNKGSYTTQINTSEFPNGIYFVTVKDEAKVVQTLKFVIAK